MSAAVFAPASTLTPDLDSLIAAWRIATAAYDIAAAADRDDPDPDLIAAGEVLRAASRAVFDHEAHGVREIQRKLEFILEEGAELGGLSDVRPLQLLLEDLRRLSRDAAAERVSHLQPPSGEPGPSATHQLASAVANLELVRIGVQLDQIFPDLLKRIDLQGERCAAAHAAAHREYPDWSVLQVVDQLAVIRRHEHLQGVYAEDSNHEALSFLITALSEKVTRLNATSPAALRTKARLVGWSDGPFRDMPVLASLLADLGALEDEVAGPDGQSPQRR